MRVFLLSYFSPNFTKYGSACIEAQVESAAQYSYSLFNSIYNNYENEYREQQLSAMNYRRNCCAKKPSLYFKLYSTQ